VSEFVGFFRLSSLQEFMDLSFDCLHLFNDLASLVLASLGHFAMLAFDLLSPHFHPFALAVLAFGPLPSHPLAFPFHQFALAVLAFAHLAVRNFVGFAEHSPCSFEEFSCIFDAAGGPKFLGPMADFICLGPQTIGLGGGRDGQAHDRDRDRQDKK